MLRVLHLKNTTILVFLGLHPSREKWGGHHTCSFPPRIFTYIDAGAVLMQARTCVPHIFVQGDS